MLNEAHWAYVGDAEDPQTWKLRFREADGSVSRRDLGRATAHLSPGGFDGRRLECPEADLPEVKRRLREAYAEIGQDAPVWVQKRGLERFEGVTVVSLEESVVDEAAGDVTVTVIRPGTNRDRTVDYPAAVLARDFKVFEGAKMFCDHASFQEDQVRPEGSLTKWVATLREVWVEADGRIRGKARVIDDGFKAKLKNLKASDMLGEMGVSIRALGEATRGKVRSVQRLLKCRSVDFVTFPGAGGVVECYESASEHPQDVDLIDESVFRERRPDLVEIIEAAARESVARENGIMSEEATDLKARLSEAEGREAELQKENETLKESATEAQQASARATAAVKIAEAIASAKDLLEPTRTRLLERFKDAETSEGIAEAIEGEMKYLREVGIPGRVDGMGDTKNEKVAPVGHEKLVATMTESYRRQGFSEDEAKRRGEVAARG